MPAAARRAPRLPYKRQDDGTSQFEHMLRNAAGMAVVFIGLVLMLLVLKAGEIILAPVLLAIVIGLMFGPAADWFERRRVPPALSALFVVLLLLIVIGAALVLLAVPLSEWVGKVPQMWSKLRSEAAVLKGPLDSVAALQSQVSTIFGDTSAMTVRVADSSTITGIALIAPAIGAQVLLFLASLYFFVATRHHIRLSVLSLFVSRRMRWRAAHIFSDVEQKVSRFLLTVTVVNICVGTAVTLAMWALGVPSPILWGAMAMVVNYVPYVGQAVMVVVLTSVGLATQSEIVRILLPVGCYLLISFAEGQVITPQVLGRTMTLNPFIIFLSITFWLWAWGPVGGLVAVPSLLVVQSIMAHVLPSPELVPKKPVRRTARMSDKDLLLANAAQAVKEQASESTDRSDKFVPPAGTAPDGTEAAI